MDLSTLPPPVYGALAKLMRLEHPLCGTRAEKLRLASEKEGLPTDDWRKQ